MAFKRSGVRLPLAPPGNRLILLNILCSISRCLQWDLGRGASAGSQMSMRRLRRSPN
jgi:hypothetical protein